MRGRVVREGQSWRGVGSEMERSDGGSLTLSTATRETLLEMRETGELTDVVVVSGGAENGQARTFSVHRAVLASSSPYFRALFSQAFVESRNRTVTLEVVPAGILGHIIDFAYLRKVPISDENAEDLFIFSDYLDVPKLREACAKYLTRNINLDNCTRLHALADCHRGLKKAVLEYILRQFEQLVENGRALVEMEYEQVIEVLRDDRLNARSEEVVFQAVKLWLSHHPYRGVHKNSLLRCVRVGQAPTELLLQMLKDKLVLSEVTLQDRICVALKLRTGIAPDETAKLEIVESRSSRARLPSQLLLAIGGWSGGSPTNAMECYDVRSGQWSDVPYRDPLGPRAYHNLAVLNSKVYMMGGFDGHTYFNTLRVFDPREKGWREKGPMHVKRCYVSSTVVEDKIMAIGGFDGGHRVDSCELYSPQDNQWTELRPMNDRRSDSNAAFLDGSVYMCGGFDGLNCLQSAERYDPRENRWRLIHGMGSRRSGVSVIALDRVIYVLGGFDGSFRLETVERYDPRIDSWSPVAPMQTRRSNFAVASIEGLIYAGGGFNGTTTIPEVECYDPRIDRWTPCAPMNVNRSALRMCQIETTGGFIPPRLANLPSSLSQLAFF